MKFLKTHSFGNDFIILNDASLISKKNLSLLAKKLCNRHLGVGADGILIVLPSEKADIRMRIINSDGSEAKMCGNGMRCFAKYIFEYGVIKQKEIAVETLSGTIKVELETCSNKVTSIKVNMGKPVFKKNNYHSISISNKKYHITALSMGAPHAVIFTNVLDKNEIIKVGPIVEQHKLFPGKTNVDFVKVVNPAEIKVVTWERGVGLSQACGTGACASVVASSINNRTERNVVVHLGLGDLFVKWDSSNVVYMIGSSPENICEGKVLL